MSNPFYCDPSRHVTTSAPTSPVDVIRVERRWPKFVVIPLMLLALLLLVARCTTGGEETMPPGEAAERVGNLVLLAAGVDAALLEGTNLEVVECTNFDGVPNGKHSADYSTGWTVASGAAVDEMIGRLHSSPFHAHFLPDPASDVEGATAALFIRTRSGERWNGERDDMVVVTMWANPSGAFSMTASIYCG